MMSLHGERDRGCELLPAEQVVVVVHRLRMLKRDSRCHVQRMSGGALNFGGRLLHQIHQALQLAQLVSFPHDRPRNMLNTFQSV